MGTAHTKMQRMQAIKTRLFQNPDGVYTPELAEEFGVDDSTIRRALAEMGAQKMPIGEGRPSGWWRMTPSAEDVELAKAVLNYSRGDN